MAGIDLRPIGINMNLNPETFLNLRNYAALDPLIRKVETDNIQLVRMADEDELVPTSSVTIDGITYTVETHLGGGSYGKVGKVRASNGHIYAMKVQFSDVGISGKEDRHDYYLEALNHFMACFYSAKDGCLGVPIFYQIAVNHANGRVYFIMEMIHATGRSLLQTHVDNPAEKAKVVRDILTDCSSLLHQLWETLQFNHGDCKDDNVGVSADGRFKLLDFGFSTLKPPGMRKISTSLLVTNPRIGRDLTQLALSIYSPNYGLKFLYEPGITSTIKTEVENILNMEGCNLLHMPLTCFGMNVYRWEDTYDLLNGHDNPKGFHSVVYQNMMRLTGAGTIPTECISPPFPNQMPNDAGPSALILSSMFGPLPPPVPMPAPAVVADVKPKIAIALLIAAGVLAIANIDKVSNVFGAGLGYLAGFVGLSGGGGIKRKKKLTTSRKIARKLRNHGRKYTRKSSNRRTV